MGYKTIFQILLVLAIISTICISVIKPKMHKSVMIYNSDYKIVTNQSVKISDKDIPILVQNSNIENSSNVEVGNKNLTVTDNQSVVVQDVNMNSTQTRLQNSETRGNSVPINIAQTNINNVSKNVGNIKNITTTNTKVTSTPAKTTVTPTKVINTQTKSSGQKVTNQSPQIDLQKIINNAKNSSVQSTTFETTPTKQETPKQTTPTTTTTVQKPITANTTAVNTTQKPTISTTKTTTQTAPKTSATTQNVTLTAAEEEIAWNKWRSNLQNSIMKDVNLPVVPNGTVFRFTFDVDKYGKVSNVQTWSDNKAYTPYAIQFIAPVIRSYQGHSILNFPTGSKRVTTHFEGAWKMSTSSKYSTPNDYNDIEKVKN